MNIDSFRSNFPEFSDPGQYPVSMIMFWIAAGEMLLSRDHWGSLYDHGLSLFVAHNIVLAAGNKAASASSGNPGQVGGVVQSKSVGSVSVNYDTAASMQPNAGHWNSTIYGRQYASLVRLVGAVAYQL